MYQDIIDLMKLKGLEFREDVTYSMLENVEEKYNIIFPESLKNFYIEGMPVSNGFIDWISDSCDNEKYINSRLTFPKRCILADVEMNEVWIKNWGIRPKDDIEACNIAKAYLEKSALLIPIYSHRYIPYIECDNNPPVLSVYGSDIIYYGLDLRDWLFKEFADIKSDINHKAFPQITGWDDFIS